MLQLFNNFLTGPPVQLWYHCVAEQLLFGMYGIAVWILWSCSTKSLCLSRFECPVPDSRLGNDSQCFHNSFGIPMPRGFDVNSDVSYGVFKFWIKQNSWEAPVLYVMCCFSPLQSNLRWRPLNIKHWFMRDLNRGWCSLHLLWKHYSSVPDSLKKNQHHSNNRREEIQFL